MNWEIFMSWQFGFTLLAVLAVGLWQFRSIKRSRDRRGEHGHVSHPPGAPDVQDRGQKP